MYDFTQKGHRQTKTKIKGFQMGYLDQITKIRYNFQILEKITNYLFNFPSCPKFSHFSRGSFPPHSLSLSFAANENVNSL